MLVRATKFEAVIFLACAQHAIPMPMLSQQQENGFSVKKRERLMFGVVAPS
jgi:hypothetical protein